MLLVGLPKAVLFLEGEVEMLVAQPRVPSQGVGVWKKSTLLVFILELNVPRMSCDNDIYESSYMS